MKTLCDREGLLTAFGMVSGVAPARSPKPILQNLKLVVDDSGATLMATDQEVGIRYRVLGVKGDQSGSVILPTARMSSILKANSSDKELAIEVDGDQLIVRSLSARYRLPSEDPSLFPDVPDFEAAGYHVISAADLKRMVRRTMFATELESARFALGGVLFELADDSITLVGTDGRRLAHAVAVAEAEGGAQPPAGQPVVPVKALKLIDRNLDDDDPPVHIAFPGGNAVLIRTHQAVIHSRLVEGRFPRYRDVFPAACEAKVTVEAGMLRSRVEQAAIVTSDESRGVDFSFREGMLTLSGNAADVGSSQVEMPIPYAGKDVVIMFDPHYLLDMLKTLDDETPVTIELIDDKNAAVVRTADRYSYVIMPLTRER